jgi:penicillin-binding protein 1A
MDTPEQMGRETGSSSAVPIVKDFLETVLKDADKVPFRIPDGVTLAPINRTTGEPSYIGAPDFILEAFKPGTEPTVGGLNRTVRFGSGTDTLGFFDPPAPLAPEAETPTEDAAEDKITPRENETENIVPPAGLRIGTGEDAAVTNPAEGDTPTDAEDGPAVTETAEVTPAEDATATPDAEDEAPEEVPADEEEAPAEPPTPKPIEKPLDDGLY